MLNFNKYYIIIPLLILFFASPAVLISQNNVAKVLYDEGIRKYILKDYKGAINDFKSAYDIDKEDAKIRKLYQNALIKQGNIEYKSNNLESAESYYRKALSLSSGEDNDLRDKLGIIQEQIAKKRGTSGEKVKMTPEEILAIENPDMLKEKAQEGDRKREEIAQAAADVKKIQMPFNIEKFIREQYEENKKILDKIIEDQKSERANLLKNMEIVAESQSNDRKFFSRYLLLILGVSMFIIITTVIIVVIMLRRQSPALAAPSYDIPAIEYNPRMLLDYTRDIDETKYVTDEHYSDIVRLKRLGELFLMIQKGNITWDAIQEYIPELNHDLKAEILKIAEKKIKSGEGRGGDGAYEILLSLVTAGDSEISERSMNAFRGAAGEAGVTESDAPDMRFFLQLGRMTDEKTVRPGHSTGVAKLSHQIARKLNDFDFEPSIAEMAGLIHDIGYIETDGKIFLKRGKLRPKEYAEIKKHVDRGTALLGYADLPKVFIDGIRCHHERFDGSGYPKGLKGKRIPVVARIIGAADYFNALTSKRVFRRAMDVNSCLTMMNKLSGKKFDPDVVEIIKEIYNFQPDSKDE